MQDQVQRDWKEARRLRAFELKQKGWQQTDIAEALGVTDGAVSQWMSRAREGGKEAPRKKKHPGREPRLSDQELRRLPELLKQGPEHYGFRGAVWTRARVGKVIEEEFGASYSDGHVGELLAKIGWTRQKPTKRASERDEEAIEMWREQRWHELKKAETEDRTVLFVDEAGFYMMPNAIRTYAPSGETPEVNASASRDHLSAISAITPSGKLYTSVQERAFDGAAIVGFLRHLLRHVEGGLSIVWDGLPAHRSKKVKAFLSETDRRVHLEQLPGYAPDLNPDEGIWQHLKNVELKNVCCQHLQQLREELRLAVERLRHKTDVITGCFGLAGLKL